MKFGDTRLKLNERNYIEHSTHGPLNFISPYQEQNNDVPVASIIEIIILFSF